MNTTLATYRLGARDAEGPFASFANRSIEWGPKRGPGAVGIELGVAGKEFGITDPAVVSAVDVDLSILTGVGSFGSALSDTELLGAQAIAKFGFGVLRDSLFAIRRRSRMLM